MHLRTFAAALVLLISAIRPGAAEPTAPVLVYHRFDSAHPAAMTVTTPVFAEQLASLTSRNIAVVRLHELVDRLHNGVNLPAPAVALTADDGHESVYTDMFPLIQRYHVPVTLFIYPSAISNASYALTWDQIREMMKSGLVEVQGSRQWRPQLIRARWLRHFGNRQSSGLEFADGPSGQQTDFDRHAAGERRLR